MPFKELSEEQYNALSPEQKKVYNDAKAASQNIAAAQQAAPQATSGATGTISKQGADQITESGTRSEQSSVSNSTNVNTGTSVSSQQGRSESYVQDNYTPEELEKFNKQYLPLHGRFTFNEKGEVVRNPNSTFYDAIGVDREKLRGERDRQERIQRMRKLEHGLANSAMLVSDMISAGIGGNVYKRDKDKTNEEADKDIARLREQQIADDMAAKMQDIQDQEKWSADYWKAFNDWRKEKQKHISENSSTGSQQSVQSGQQVTTSQQSSKSNEVQTTTYDDALKGGGLRGYSRRSYGYGGGGKQNLTYWPMKIVNGAHGEEYMSFALDKEEKESLSKAIASSINTAADSGNQAAIVLRDKYYKKLKRNDKSATWDYDALVNDGALYQVPGVLNRYLDELTQMGITHDVNGQNVPYTRRQLYEMMTGDKIDPATGTYKHLPAGVNLGQSRL